MSNSRAIAGFMGPVLAALGVALLINRDFVSVMAAELAHGRAVVVLSGVILLTEGLAVVRAHNVWAGGWLVIVTVLGWLAIVGGLARMWFPGSAVSIAQSFADNEALPWVAGAALLIFGAFLSWKAYGPET